MFRGTSGDFGEEKSKKREDFLWPKLQQLTTRHNRWKGDTLNFSQKSPCEVEAQTKTQFVFEMCA